MESLEAEIKKIEDLGRDLKLYDSLVAKESLSKIYEEEDSKTLRVSAGQALGYSKIRIWANEHEAAIVIGILSIGGGVALYKTAEFLATWCSQYCR